MTGDELEKSIEGMTLEEEDGCAEDANTSLSSSGFVPRWERQTKKIIISNLIVIAVMGHSGTRPDMTKGIMGTGCYILTNVGVRPIMSNTGSFPLWLSSYSDH